jgi:hypothetical protein
MNIILDTLPTTCLNICIPTYVTFVKEFPSAVIAKLAALEHIFRSNASAICELSQHTITCSFFNFSGTWKAP